MRLKQQVEVSAVQSMKICSTFPSSSLLHDLKVHAPF